MTETYKEGSTTEIPTTSPLADYKEPMIETEETSEQEPISESEDKDSQGDNEPEIVPTNNHTDQDSQGTTVVTRPFSINEIEGFEKIPLELQILQREYREEYTPIPYEGKDPNSHYFFLSLNAYKEIVLELPRLNSDLKKKIKGPEKWQGGIGPILYKALIAESVKYSQWVAEEIARKNSSKENLDILELCTGAGITTCMIYLERLNTNPEGRTKIVTVDNSAESIACASLVASCFGIQSKICTLDTLSEIENDFNGIIFVAEDASIFADKIDVSNNFTTIVSDNGISYLPEKTQTNILTNLSEKFPDSTLYVSSLKNGKSVELGLPFKLKGIIKGPKFPVKPTSEQYVEKDGVIVETYTPETKAFFELTNKMAKSPKGWINLVKLLSILSSATKSSQALNNEILTPVEKTREIAPSIGLKQIASFPESPNAPCEVGVFKSEHL